AFTLAPGSDGIDLVNEQVLLTMSTAAGEFYSANLPPGSFELRGNQNPPRWELTDAARQGTGIERFDILLGNNQIVFVDRAANLPPWSYAQVTVGLTIGNDAGTRDVTLVEQSAGSERWRVP